MTRKEEHETWIKLQELRKEFNKVMRDRHPHMCYTQPKLSEEIHATIKTLTEKLRLVKDGEPEALPKAKKEKEEAPATETAAAAESKATPKTK